MKIREISGIRKTVILITGWLMILCMFGSFATAEGVPKETFYLEGISSLGDMTLESAQNAVDDFNASGNYGLTPLYKQYALSLIDILSIDIGEVNLQTTISRLQVVERNEEFRDSLAENNLPSCESLKQYIQARQYEDAKEYIKALNIYNEIFSVLDSLERQINVAETAYHYADELYRKGNYVAAAEIFQNLDYAGSAEKYQQILANHKHRWKNATCTEPKTCLVFGETEGKPLGHDWKVATCTKPKTCKRCGITAGKPLGHDWQVVSCTEPQKCSRCGAINGKAPGHDWQAATCTKPKTCKRCGATEGKALGHNWQAGSCTKPKKCSRCGVTNGAALGHDWQAATCRKPKTCKRCGVTEGKALGHNWQAATCRKPKTCKRCGVTEGKALGHNWQAATCRKPKTCKRCGVTRGKALGHDWREATIFHPQKCVRCGASVGSALSTTVGSIVRFGHYEQDNNLKNGKEAIEWIVLENDKANHKVLLLSRYGLDSKPFNKSAAEITWGKCSLRSWLNKDFLSTAFSAEEQAAILTTRVNNSASQAYFAENASKNTRDQIFLLSYGEANRYLGVTMSDLDNTKSRVAPTEYAVSHGAKRYDNRYTADGSRAGWWWLRLGLSDKTKATCVDTDGSLGSADVNSEGGIVRPALWVDLGSGN